MMVPETISPIAVRDAQEADLPALIAIKGAGTEIIHRDRLRDARTAGFRYLVLLTGDELIGRACLVARRPASWSDAGDAEHLPQIADLQVRETQRGQGYGSAFGRAIERLAAEAGSGELFLTVDPLNNPRAYRLYLRLGYRPLQSAPYLKALGVHRLRRYPAWRRGLDHGHGEAVMRSRGSPLLSY